VQEDFGQTNDIVVQWAGCRSAVQHTMLWRSRMRSRPLRMVWVIAGTNLLIIPQQTSCTTQHLCQFLFYSIKISLYESILKQTKG